MNDFSETRASWRRLMEALAELEPVERHRFWMENLIGPVVMAAAIIGVFGWFGALFCIGWQIRDMGKSK
jgi:hypothetical protein